MAKCIAVANQKGGVGKTTTAVNLASSITLFGQDVLLLDMDPQANATSGLGFDKRNLNGGSIYNVLMGDRPISEIVSPTSVPGLDIVASNINLIGAELEMVGLEGREHRLKKCLEPLQEKYNYIIIDCPPSLGLITLNCLCAAQSVLIPIQCEYYAMEGLSQLMDTVQRVQQSLNPTLEIEGVLLTMYDSRIRLSNDVITEVQKVFSEKVYKTRIPRNIRLAESPGFGKSVMQYDPSSRGAQSYMQVAREFLKKNGHAIEEPAGAEESAPSEALVSHAEEA